ncbi:MAG: hypothetical protein ACP5K1_07255, partial [Candidatus Bathyarchaeia archaeon]
MGRKPKYPIWRIRRPSSLPLFLKPTTLPTNKIRNKYRAAFQSARRNFTAFKLRVWSFITPP